MQATPALVKGCLRGVAQDDLRARLALRQVIVPIIHSHVIAG